MIVLVALIQQSLMDPSGPGAITPAADWIQSTLTGSVATSIAALAVASVGFGLLSGRLDVRRGLAALLGCFVLFGASYIARGLMGSAEAGVAPVNQAPSPPVFARPPPGGPPPGGRYDPYAGASVPR